MFELTPLFADAEFIKAIIVGGGILLYLLSQLGSAFGDKKPNSRSRRANDDRNRDNFDGDVDDFVNQATGYVMPPAVVDAQIVDESSNDMRRRKLRGKPVDQADERAEKRLHDTFDHEVGSLSHEDVVTVEETTPAEEIAEMLKTPKGMRDAIILSEILNRPDTDRW